MSTTPPDRTPPEGEEKTPLPEIRGHKLSRVIGTGGMSTVYLGKQVVLQREVAIKVMLPEALEDETSRRRFENEARTIARLDHPHIVGIHEVGRTGDGLPYYTMPYLPRGHLGQRDFSDANGPGHANIRAILRDLLSALEYAHARGVVHRDVKAENVLFDESGRPLLADFGIALRRGFGSRVTTAGLAVGSTAYMAPEQARGEEVDARADLYSVGVLAWEMLTGHLPYMAADALSMAVKHAQDPIPRLPRPLRHWQRFFDRALAKYPGKRFSSAEEMRAALDRVPQRRIGPLSRTADRARHAISAMQHLPRAAWIVIALLIAAGIGVGLRELAGGNDNDFFRVGHGQQTSDDGAARNRMQDASEAMLRPLPISPAERWVRAAGEQLDNNKLIAPEHDNAYDSLVTGWKADPSNPDLPAISERLIKALGGEAAKRIDKADDKGAGDAIRHAADLAMLSTQSDGEAMTALHRKVTAAYLRRIEDAISRVDQAAALQAVAQARDAGVDPASLKTLQARANAVPTAGDTINGTSNMKVVRAGKGLIGISPVEISREDYSRFVAATRRPAALCRAKASLFRILKPISWDAPGFTQSPAQPVVCVSWGDANSYARWMSKRSGHRYRLPSAAEARLLPANGGKKPVAEWLLECSNGCRERMTAGRSWREASGGRPLDATRGYDDVGFRLVREL